MKNPVPEKKPRDKGGYDASLVNVDENIYPHFRRLSSDGWVAYNVKNGANIGRIEKHGDKSYYAIAPRYGAFFRSFSTLKEAKEYIAFGDSPRLKNPVPENERKKSLPKNVARYLVIAVNAGEPVAWWTGSNFDTDKALAENYAREVDARAVAARLAEQVVRPYKVGVETVTGFR